MENRHIDFLVWVDLNSVFDEHLEDKFQSIFGGRRIEFIYDNEDELFVNTEDVKQKIRYCEAIFVYSNELKPTKSTYYFLLGLASVLGKKVYNIRAESDINSILNYEIESKFLISEKLYKRLMENQGYSREDMEITQYLDQDGVRYRETIYTDHHGNPFPESKSQFTKEIKGDFSISSDWLSTKTEFSTPIELREFVIKTKEFKRLHNYERPIKKHRTRFYIPTQDGVIHFEINKIKISTHTMYTLEMERLVPFTNIDCRPIGFINNAIGTLSPYRGIIMDMSRGLEDIDKHYHLIKSDDNINNKAIMGFIMDRMDRKYLDFIAFKNKCNELCYSSVIKTPKVSKPNEPNKIVTYNKKNNNGKQNNNKKRKK